MIFLFILLAAVGAYLAAGFYLIFFSPRIGTRLMYKVKKTTPGRNSAGGCFLVSS